jgi:alkanesulfonate monooxygenase SsuD/methylene tetrahydromethanopterin reductase-like flavin-dependent oxidoreductase (luciferase family)
MVPRNPLMWDEAAPTVPERAMITGRRQVLMVNFETAHPWVAERRARIRFAVQAFPLPDDPNPTESVITAGLLAERVGLDGFFIGDHPGYHIEPWLHLSNIAARTDHVQLGSVVNSVFHRNPSMLARMTADLDRISMGRVMLGLGIGWNEAEFAQLGVPFRPVPERQRGMEEALEIIDGMFGPEPVTFTGETWQVTNAHITSPPVQRPRPPILLAGAGENTLRQVVRWADISNFGASKNTGNVTSDEATVQKLARIDQLCAEAGRDPGTLLKSHFTSWLMLADSDKNAKAKLDHYFPDGLAEEQTRTRIFGSPETVSAYFRSLIGMGFQYFVIQIQDSRDLETIQLLGEAIAPNFA